MGCIIHGGVLKEYFGDDTHIVIPEGVTSIADSAFFGRHTIRSVVIPEGVVRIGRWVFEGCESLESIIFPDSVKSIGHSVCLQCPRLSHVVLPKGLKNIPAYGFQQCYELKEIEIKEGAEVIEESAFCSCKNLVRVQLPEGVYKIKANAFRGCSSLKEWTMPASVSEIGSMAFDGCKQLPPEALRPQGIYFYTVQSNASKPGTVKIGSSYVVKQNYSKEAAEQILCEAKQYGLVRNSSSERCGWYTNGKTESESQRDCTSISPETILVKNGHFYGCVLTYRGSYWSYHHTEDREEPVLLTLHTQDGVLVNHIDHSTDNGDYTSSTYAHLVKR